jgi:hypothetical protein
MLGRLAVGLATPQRQGTPQPRSGGCLGVLGVALCTGIFMYGDATRTWTVMWFVVMPLICAAFVAAGWIIKGLGKGNSVQSAIRNMPDAPAEITSVKGMRERAMQIKRLHRVADLLNVTCPLCSSAPGVSCAVKSGNMHYLLDEERGLIAHGLRIQKAVAEGEAGVDDVVAQFDGRVPESLWAGLL